MGIGRPTKYTDELAQRLCDKLRKTLPIEKACYLVDIDPTTYYDWLARGESGQAPFDRFSQAVKKARAEAQEFWIDVLSASAVDKTINPNAAFFALERSDRPNWGRVEKREVEQTVKVDVDGLREKVDRETD